MTIPDGWEKIDEGWYRNEKGDVIQRWWVACGSPGKKAGWYVWHGGSDESIYTRHRTMKEALEFIQKAAI